MQGRAFFIKYRGYTDLFVFNDQPGESIETGIFETNFRYSWARMSEGETVPDEFVLVGGSCLSIGGRPVCNEELQFASIRRLGNDLYIKTDKGRRKY